MTYLALAALALMALSPAADAQDAPKCDATKPELPSEWVGWAQSVPANASMSGQPAPTLASGQTRVALHPVAHIAFVVAPERPAAADGFGGMVAFDVAKAGRVKVALDRVAWIDVVGDGKAMKSVAHGHGPACSGIRKIVEFDLAPGRYILQIVNAPEASIGAMVLLPG